MLLKVSLSTLKEMRLTCIVMKSIETYDGVHYTKDNEEGDASLVSDARGLLLTWDLGLH